MFAGGIFPHAMCFCLDGARGSVVCGCVRRSAASRGVGELKTQEGMIGFDSGRRIEVKRAEDVRSTR